MYSVTKRIDFCYGHRLLDYDGVCKHPHGHNAVAEIQVRTDQLDGRNMVCDFSDIKRIVKGWIDRELDHKMVLRHDDPLVAPLQQLNEPIFLVDSNPTVERIARLIFDYAIGEGLPVVRVKVWETPTSFAEYGVLPLRLVVFDLDGTLVDSRRDLAESANAVLVYYGCRPHTEAAIGRMVGDGAATLVRRAFTTAGCPQPPDALDRFLAIYNSRLLTFTRPYEGIVDLLSALAPRMILAVCTNKPLRPTQTILDKLELAQFFGTRVVGGDGPLPRKPDPAGLAWLIADAEVAPEGTILIGDSIVDWETAHAASVPVCMARYGFGFEEFPHERLQDGDLVIDDPRQLLMML